MCAGLAEMPDDPVAEAVSADCVLDNLTNNTSSVLSGRDGWLFSRHAATLLHPANKADIGFVEAWQHELASRQAHFSSKNIRYFHVFVPDKVTLLGDYLDEHGAEYASQRRVSPLKTLTQKYKPTLSCLIDPTAYLERQKDSYPLFWKSDTRWTPWSAYMTCQMLCSSLGVDINNQLLGYPFSETSQPMDLDGGQLPNKPQQVRLYRYWLRSKLRYANEVVRLRESTLTPGCAELADPQLGEGAHVVFENHHESTPNRTLIIFGDQHSADSRTLLTGMLAESFSEVHFVWAAGIDYDYVERVQPDVVITQCNELALFEEPVTQVDIRKLETQTLQCLSTHAVADEALPLDTTVSDPVNNGAKKSTLFHAERYALDLPLMVQDCPEQPNAEAYMSSNEVELHEIPAAQVYFTGPSWWVHDGAGNEILRHEIASNQKPAGRWRRGKRLKGTSLMFATSAGAHCYYHWMLEIMPKLGMLERSGISIDSIDHFLVREITGSWQVETLARFGIDKSRIVETAKRPNWRCDHLMHVDLNCGINLKMHRFTPQWMKHMYPPAPSEEPRIKLYISRPEGVRRGISNEHAILPLLKEAGFTIMAMEGLSVAQQAALLSRADVVMSPHGGALTNMVFCRPGVHIVEMFSRHVFPYYWGLAANCGHHYHAILEEPDKDYPRLVNARVAQSFADTQHQTAALSFDVSVDAVKAVLAKF